MSPVKRRQVICWPLAPVSCCCETLLAICTLFILLIHTDDQPHKALLICPGSRDPLGLIHQGLYKKHTHSSGFFFATHFTIDVRRGCRRLHSNAIIHYF